VRGNQAVSRHLVFVLDDGDIVVQRAANVVELVATREQRVFNDFERDHEVTDDELRVLMNAKFISGFDDMTVWLPPDEHPHEITYYYLDTRLSPPYLDMINNMLQTASLSDQYAARTRLDRVAILSVSGEPFSNLPDAAAAQTIIRKALGEYIKDMRIASMEINPRLDDTVPFHPRDFADLIREAPVMGLGDRMVLIVEPDTELTTALQQPLEASGLEVRIASTGEAAIEILMDEEPDLAIINLTLPDCHGYEIIAKIKKDPLTVDTPIIALSDLNSEADVVFALHVAKVDDYIVKPVQAAALRQRIITLMSRRL
jgi:PleD family two-component response regulator